MLRQRLIKIALIGYKPIKYDVEVAPVVNVEMDAH